MNHRLVSLFSIASLASLTSFTAIACSAQQSEGSSNSNSNSPSASEDELVNAPLDTKNTWAVGVCSSEPNADPTKGPIGACLEAGTRCTGSLVAPNVVMTARHCVHKIDYSEATGFCTGAKFGDPLGAGKVRVTLDPSVLGENVKWNNVTEVLVEATNNSCKDDIALLVLGQAVAPADATPIAIDVRPLGQTHPAALAIVGRGILTALIDLSTGAPIDADANGGLKRRFKTDMPWTCVSNNPQRACKVVDFSSPPTNDFELPFDAYFAFGGGASSGDSGSAVLRSSKFKSGKVIAVGVNSAGTYDKNGVGNFGLGVRLDVHQAWLTSSLAAKAPGHHTLITPATASAEDAADSIKKSAISA